MRYSESDTRAKLIDPAIHKQGWTEDLIRREETAGTIEIFDGKARKQAKGRVDYTLRVKVTRDTQPVAVALIEAKAAHLPPAHGLEQAKVYAACKRLNVPFVYSSNGHLFVEFDRFTGLTSAPRPMTEFPTPDQLRARYEQGMGFKLDDAVARPLLTRYRGGEATRRYYQDAAIRAVLEKIARCEKQGQPKRALLSLATGAGKTFIAVNLLKRIADAGQLRRALFVCDRDELRSQGLGAFQNVFGSEAAEVYREPDGTNHARNARIHIATYQTLDVDTDKEDANFLIAYYPVNYFSHVVIDECHRSAWGKWSQVLTRNPDAVQIGLTATPRQLQITEKTKEAQADAELTADNLRYFGEPVYEYDMSQGIEDGYLAACEIIMEHYAFKCTASVGGTQYLADLRGASRSHFVATTVDLLTTGVDVPVVRNIVFFKYVRSPIAFYQMVGRGTRLDPATGKLMFQIYDYTNATRLFGEEFKTRPTSWHKSTGDPVADERKEPRERIISVEGFNVRITDAGRYIVTQVEDKTIVITVEAYKQHLAAKLMEEAPTLEAFRDQWVNRADRLELMARLPDRGRSAHLIQQLEDKTDYDLYDVLAELGYGLFPRSRKERADAFSHKHADWLCGLPAATAATLKALTAQFARVGTEGLENYRVFQTPEVACAGGLAALKVLGRPADIMREIKVRIFAI